MSTGITYNSANPSDHSNLPVLFNDRANEIQVNQLYFFLERSVDRDAGKWDVGGRFDFLWGTDSRFITASGNWDRSFSNPSSTPLYGIALPQAYLEVVTPFLNGLSFKLGHFYTLIGNEAVQAPNTIFYSHSYMMAYGEPFTHTGVLASYIGENNFTISAGAVTGPDGVRDNFDQSPGNWNFLGGINWISDDGATSVAAALTSGDTNVSGWGNRTIASIVFNQSVTADIHYIAQYDHGFQDRFPEQASAQWYGISQYLTYALTDSVTLAVRGEWFRDNNGFRVTATPATYYEVTTDVNWSPNKWLTVRLEARNDWADSIKKIYDEGTRNHQFTFGVNTVIVF